MSEPTVGGASAMGASAMGASAMASDPARSQREAATDEDDAPQRGRLSIDNRVVEKVAAYAVQQVGRATGAPRRVLGVTVGDAAGDSTARVKARVDGTLATVTVAMTVRWPASVGEVTTDARRRVREEVRRITAVEVRQIDIDVVSMSSAASDEPRVR